MEVLSIKRIFHNPKTKRVALNKKIARYKKKIKKMNSEKMYNLKKMIDKFKTTVQN